MASRILLADDSITIQKVVNLTFADEGIEVIAVSNGDLAERRLAEIVPDLVLADIFMPGKNGYELCEAIKESSQFCNVPVVLLVGAFEPFDQAEARRVKADAHLTKPFESRTLVETVRRLISASWRSTTGPIAMPAQFGDHGPPFDENEAVESETQFVSAFEPTALDDTLARSAPDVRNTGELASPSPDARDEILDLSLGDSPFGPTAHATLTDTTERFEPLELSSNGVFSPAEVTPSFALDSSEVRSVSDEVHEMQEPHQITPQQDSLPFENVQPSALHGVNISGAGEGEHWISPGSYETARLDRPTDDSAWRGSNGSALNYPTTDFSVQSEVSQGAAEGASETAVATLLAVDEPLGDVLFGETAVMGSLSPLEASSGDALSLELGEPELVEAQPVMPTHFDLVEIVEAAEDAAQPTETHAAEPPPPVEFVAADAAPSTAEPTQATSAEPAWSAAEPAEATIAHQTVAESSTPEPVAVEAQVEETTSVVEQVSADVEHHDFPAVEQVAGSQPTAAEQTFEFVETHEPSELQPVSAETAGDSDWTTPAPASHTTAQLDPVVMPIETAEQSAESTEEPHESAGVAGFTAPATWHEEEARFTPIDVDPARAESLSDEMVSSAAEPQETPVGQTVEQTDEAAASNNAEVPTGTVTPAALSSAAIEEIVRRVVAEMSESVVREVAWEVVPDCVERVIEQLTRESLSKRA